MRLLCYICKKSYANKDQQRKFQMTLMVKFYYHNLHLEILLNHVENISKKTPILVSISICQYPLLIVSIRQHPLVSISIRQYLLVSISIRQYPLVSISIHQYPLVFNQYPLVSISVRQYPIFFILQHSSSRCCRMLFPQRGDSPT